MARRGGLGNRGSLRRQAVVAKLIGHDEQDVGLRGRRRRGRAGQLQEACLAQGSGRSIESFHLLDALESMPELFTKFGGHFHAAGLTMPAGRVAEFRARFNDYAAARLTREDFVATLTVDAEVELRELSETSIAEVLALGPFGTGNPQPIFAARGLEVAAPAAVLKEKHLRIPLRQNGKTVFLKAWNMAEYADEFTPARKIDAAFTLEEDSYALARGYAGWSATLRDFRRCGR